MAVERLVDGFRRFRERFYEEDPVPFEELVRLGQSPRAAVVACADSRVGPGTVLQADPGELFVIRNVANMVPPKDETSPGDATIAALQYAVMGLQVDDVIVMGHSHCGGIQALMAGGDDAVLPEVAAWVAALDPVRRGFESASQGREIAREVEKAAIVQSLRNLEGYPWIRERVDSNRLTVHGWYFDLARGTLAAFDRTSGEFVDVSP